MMLSIVIPCYNEQKTLSEIVTKVQNLVLPNNFEKELIIVNDCSKDRTLEIANQLSGQYPNIKVVSNPKNLGKSQSVKRGILLTKGDFVIIQDADLEYNPIDIGVILHQMLVHKCDVGYGNRFGLNNGVIYVKNFIGNVFLSAISNLFTIWHNLVVIPDMEVCYKLVRGDVIREIAATLVSKSNFGFEPEITAKLSRYRYKAQFLKFVIVPIKYYPRSIQEGKKMKAYSDGIKALFEILRFNLFY